ncbi:MAG: hypothetical protein IJL58_00795 [Bacteroidales bacterium]|nr:hypothetical protein [Bacteroidales bacterium]
MEKIVIKDIIKSYQENRRDQFSDFINEVKQGNIASRFAFPRIRKSAFELLKEQEYRLNTLLKDCQTDTEVMDVLSKALEDIPFISNKTIIDFSEYYCYCNDIHIDDNCETFLSTDGKKLLKKNQLTVEKIREAILESGIPPFSNYEMIDFVNNYCVRKTKKKK